MTPGTTTPDAFRPMGPARTFLGFVSDDNIDLK